MDLQENILIGENAGIELTDENKKLIILCPELNINVRKDITHREYSLILQAMLALNYYHENPPKEVGKNTGGYVITNLNDGFGLPTEKVEKIIETYSGNRYGSTTANNLLATPIITFGNSPKEETRTFTLEQLKDCWNASDENMRRQFSTSDYKRITFEQFLKNKQDGK